MGLVYRSKGVSGLTPLFSSWKQARWFITGTIVCESFLRKKKSTKRQIERDIWLHQDSTNTLYNYKPLRRLVERQKSLAWFLNSKIALTILLSVYSRERNYVHYYRSFWVGHVGTLVGVMRLLMSQEAPTNTE